MEQDTRYIDLQLEIRGDDAEVTEALTYQLRDELKEDSHIRRIRSANITQKPPEGAKGIPIESLTLGLLVAEASFKSVTGLLNLLESWTKRGKDRRLSVSMEVEGRKITIEFDSDKDTRKEVKALMEEMLKIKPKDPSQPQ